MDASTMDNLVRELEYEEDTFRKVLDTGMRKTQLIIRNDTAGLSKLVVEEQALTDQLTKLGKVRAQLMSRLTAEYGLAMEDITVTKLCNLMPKPQSDRLSHAQAKLRQVVMEVSLRNGINQRLIENALEYVQFNLQLLTQPTSHVPQYGRTGNEVTSKMTRSMLDLRS